MPLPLHTSSSATPSPPSPSDRPRSRSAARTWTGCRREVRADRALRTRCLPCLEGRGRACSTAAHASLASLRRTGRDVALRCTITTTTMAYCVALDGPGPLAKLLEPVAQLGNSEAAT